MAALDAGLTPIVCVGKREEKNVEKVPKEQFPCGFGALSEGQFERIVVAYEPIWAIGDGKTTSPDVAADAHRLIRAQVKSGFRADAANNVRILLRRQRQTRQCAV